MRKTKKKNLAQTNPKVLEFIDIIRQFLGSIRDLQNRSRALSGDNPSPSSKNASSSAHCSTSFGPFYGRQMCVYVLRLQNILTEQKARFFIFKYKDVFNVLNSDGSNCLLKWTLLKIGKYCRISV